MKTTAAILILIANLWSLTSDSPLSSLFDFDETGGGIMAQQDPPEDDDPIFLPPPR